MSKVVVALMSIVVFASCQKEATFEGSGYKSTPLVWINGIRIDSLYGALSLGSSTQLRAKAFVALKSNCNIYCNVTLDDLGPNENTSLGMKYSGDNIALIIGPRNTDGSNVNFQLMSPTDVGQKVLSNYYELNIVFTGPSIEYYKLFKIHIKR